MKLIVFLVVSILAVPCFAESYSRNSKITQLTVDNNFVRVRVQNMQAYEGCSDQSWYIIDTSSKKDMLTAVLAQYARGENVHFQLSGCHRGMPRISHVYMCTGQGC